MITEVSTKRTITRVCDYIAEHLDQELSLETLSNLSGFSKYHFHRRFRAAMGLNLNEFVRLMRLKRASYRLVFQPAERVLDIALEAGFESPEAFARAFKRQFDQTPTHFRRRPQWSEWQRHFDFEIPQGDPIPMNVQITEFPTTLVALLEHHGPPSELNHTVSRFIEWRKSTGLSPRDRMATYGVPHNDPNMVAPEDFHWDICGEILEPIPRNSFGVVTGEIPGGRCARVRYPGSRDTMDETIYGLFRDWLPASGEETRDAPLFFHYLNFFPEVAEAELVTDIYLPLKGTA